MFKIFLVEDEAPIRESIRDTIGWDAAGFDYVGDAADGEIALRDIRRMKPDILITDIRIPFIDGLELSRIVRNEFPNIKILILSGYDDFKYAQKAISLGVSEYLLKPIKPKELIWAANKAAFDLSREISSRPARLFSHEARGNLREAFYHDLLEGKFSPSTARTEAGKLGIPPDRTVFIVGTLRNDSTVAGLLTAQEERKIFSGIIGSRGAMLLKYPEDGYTVIFEGTEDDDIIEETAFKILSEIVDKSGEARRRFYSGLGGMVNSSREIVKSFREAEIASNYALFTKSESPCRIGNARDGTEASGAELSEYLDHALELLQYGDFSEIDELAKKIKSTVTRGAAHHYAYFCILMTASRALRNMDADQEVIPQLSCACESAFAVDTPEKLESGVREVCERVIQHRRDYLANRRRSIAVAAKQYIDRNYSDPDLSLKKVAGEVQVSPTYFSAIFSGETCEAFSEYLARVRMTNAKRLLKTTFLSAAEISEKVGYNDPQYFSRAFRRSEGMSIRTFRNKN
ncbi:MAG: response regulator [Synergistaceae bacterium]|jgi:two-component system response regulator YesN|nr:response regulator [Synergistaceae bacterium]